jgi:hypothetical protein
VAQHDYVIANGTGAAVRSDLNNGLAAIVSQNSGTTEPTTTYAYMRWADTTAGVMKMRNGANNAWITLYQLDGEWSTIAFENGSASAPSIYFKDSGTDTGIYSPGTDQVAISTGGTGRLFVDSNGRVGLGTSSPGARFDVVSADNTAATTIVSVAANNQTSAIQLGYNRITQVNSTPASAYLQLGVSNNTTAVHIDGTGKVGIGTTSATELLSVNGNLWLGNGGGSGGSEMLRIWNDNGVERIHGSGNPSAVAFGMGGHTSVSEAFRIDTSRRLLVGTTTDSIGTAGTVLYGATGASITRSGGVLWALNRLTNDGNLIEFYQDGTVEGAISVSGSTVTYGGGHLARWSQLPNDDDPSGLLKGTVMSNLNEMCEWGEEDNEQLNKTKVSDVEGDPNVAGVFVSTSFDEVGPQDFFVAMTGDMIIRIAEGVTVQRGDLLMSAGDGTAKPQDDDIVRSKTIAKVTSTHVTCTYDDGSYCVPCVLMAC